MESLRPDRDELDHFRRRNSDNKKNSKTANKQAPNSGSEYQGSHAPVAVSKGTPIWLIFLIFVMMGGIGGLSWLIIGQQKDVALLTSKLNEASGTIDQGQLIMARFEGERNEADLELQQSGTAVEKQLAFLDKEMRKLWVISNERNKKAIEKNADLFTSLDVKLGKVLSQQKELKGLQEGLLKSVDVLRSDIIKKVSGNGLRISSLANEVSIIRAEQDEALEGLKDSIKKTLSFGGQAQGLLNKLSTRISESEDSIVSIDASRRQINERLVALERHLTSLQLKIKSTSK